MRKGRSEGEEGEGWAMKSLPEAKPATRMTIDKKEERRGSEGRILDEIGETDWGGGRAGGRGPTPAGGGSGGDLGPPRAVRPIHVFRFRILRP